MCLRINFLKCALISTLLLFTTSLMAATKLKPMHHESILIAKVGNKRHIARLGTVIPLLQKPRFMCYFTAIGMRDSKSSTEGNFGLGFRWLSSKSITGFYGFYDLRKSAAGNKFNQITLGFEKLYRNFEFRTNFYLPTQDSKEASNRTIANVNFRGHNTEIVLFQNRVIERPMKGLDLEFGLTIPRHRALSTHIAFYSFVGHRVESVAGCRWRAEYRFSPWFAMNAEANYDKARKFSGYVGLKLSYSMGQSLRGIKVNSLLDKMTMLPVRDIDIVVGDQVSNISLGQVSLPGIHPLIQQADQRNGSDVLFTGGGSFKTMADFNAHYHGDPVSGFVAINTQYMKQLSNYWAPSKVEILTTNLDLYQATSVANVRFGRAQTTPYIKRSNVDAKVILDSSYNVYGSSLENYQVSFGVMPENCAKCIDIANVISEKVDRACLSRYRDSLYYEREHGVPATRQDITVERYDEDNHRWYFTFELNGRRYRQDLRHCYEPNAEVEALFPSLPDVESSQQVNARDQRAAQIAADAAFARALQENMRQERQQADIVRVRQRVRQEQDVPQVIPQQQPDQQPQQRLADVPEVANIINNRQNTGRRDRDVKRSITLLRDRYGVIENQERQDLLQEIAGALNYMRLYGAVRVPNGLSQELQAAYTNDGRYNDRLKAAAALRTVNRIVNRNRAHTVESLGGEDINLQDAMYYVYKSIRGDGLANDENFDVVARTRDFVSALYEMAREYNRNDNHNARYTMQVGDREVVFFDDRLTNQGGRENDSPACGHGHFNKMVETLNQIDPAVNLGGTFEGLALGRVEELLMESFNNYRQAPGNQERAQTILAQSDAGYDMDEPQQSVEWRDFLTNVARPHIRQVMREEFYVNHQNPDNRLIEQQELDNWIGVEDSLVYMPLT